MTLLVVKHDQVRSWICGWVHNLSVYKEPDVQDMTTYPTTGNDKYPLAFYLHRLRHRPTRKQRLWLNQCSGRPRTIQENYHHPLQENNNGRRNYYTLPKQCIQPTRPPNQDSIRLQPPIRSKVHTRTLETIRDLPSAQHGISPPNRWRNWTGKPRDQIILTDLLQLLPRQLGGPDPICRIFPQHAKAFCHQEIAIWNSLQF